MKLTVRCKPVDYLQSYIMSLSINILFIYSEYKEYMNCNQIQRVIEIRTFRNHHNNIENGQASMRRNKLMIL